MLAGACVFLVAALVLYVGRFYSKSPAEKRFFGFWTTFCAGVSIGFLGLSSFVTVPAGYVGVPIVWGAVQNRTLSEGFHFVNPLSEVVTMSARIHTYTMSGGNSEGGQNGDSSIDALSSRGMSIKMDVSVPHRLSPHAAAWVYKNLGPDYEEQIVRPAISTAVRQATSQFTEEEVYASKRTELAEVMLERLNAQIGNIVKQYGKGAPESPIVFPEVQLRNVILPPTVRDAINEKIATEQKIVQAQNEAKRKKIEAEGIQAFQDIVSRGITPDLLRWKGIEATVDLASSPNSKIVIVGNAEDELPIILSEDMGKSNKTVPTEVAPLLK